MAFEELQVAGEPGVWQCARHSNVTTRLRCGRCEKPICPKCTVMGPTGARCRQCLSNRSSHIYQVKPAQFALSFGLAAVLGGVGAFLVSILGFFWLFALLYAPALGPLIGGIVTRTTGGKRGSILAGVTIVGLVIGALIGALLFGTLFNPIFYLMLAIAAVGVWSFLK